MIPLWLLTLISLWLTQSLWQPGWFTSHDGFSHLVRLAQYLTLLSDGQWPPRFSGALLGNLGYPIFVFSYPLPFIFGSLFYWLGFGLAGALKLVFGFSLLWSGWGMYLWLKQYFNPLAAFAGAFLFIVAPYRLVLIFVRAAVGEALALSFLPWLFYALSRRSWQLTAVFTALAVLAHSLFWPMYGGLVLTYLWLMKTSRRKLLAGLGLGMGLAAFYWLPLVWEKSLTVFDQYYVNLAAGHLLDWKQLVYSRWGFGYSHAGTEQDAMSFQVGIAQWLAVGGTLAWIIFKRKLSLLMLWAIVWFVLSVMIMADWPPARFVWQNFSLIRMIDIPWRFLAVAVFCASFLAAFLVNRLKTFKWPAAMIFLIAALYTNRNHLRINQAVNRPETDFFRDWGTTTFLNEYRPRWRRSDKIALIAPKLYAGAETEKMSLVVNRSNRLEFTTDFSGPQPVQVNLLYYPGWRFYDESGEIKLGNGIQIVSLENDERQAGFGPWSFCEIEGTLRLAVPAGEQRYRFVFSETPLRKTADLISLISLAIFLKIGYNYYRIR